MKKIKLILILMVASVGSTFAQSLEVLQKEAVEKNLELKILEKEYLAALEKAPQVSQLPDPEIGLGIFPLPVETRVGPQITRLSATQMLPWFGTRQQRADLENAKALALFERMDARALNLFYEIKKAYFKLYEVQQSQIIIQRNLEILEGLEKVALAKVESGAASAADVLRVQMKMEELEQQIKILKVAEENPTIAINQLLNRDLETPVEIGDSLEFAVLTFGKNNLLQNIEKSHPMLRMFELQQDISNKAIELNAVNGKPTFGVGLDYTMVRKREFLEFENNGRDILQVRASVKIPLYKKQYAAKEREEQLKIEGLDLQKNNLLSQFSATIEQAYSDYEQVQLKMELYDRQIVLAQATLRILETTYSTQRSNFEELLRLEQELIEFDLKKLEAIVESHLAKSKIEQFIR